MATRSGASLQLPAALSREIAVLEENLGVRGDARLYRARLDNLPVLLGELMVAGEVDPGLFQLPIPFTFGKGPLQDKAQVAAIRARAGELAAAYRKDPKPPREKYLRLIDPRLAENEGVEVKVPRSPTSARFAREDQALRRLNHRNIVRRYARILDPVLGPCLLLEHVEGKTLGEILDRRLVKGAGPLPLPAVAHIFLQLAKALSHAHQAGICHGDVRPAHMVNEKPRDARPGKPQGIVKLFEWGSARPLDGSLFESRDERPPESLLFSAPEQLAGRPVSAETDVYQLGATLFALATGAVPYSNLPAEEFVAQITSPGPHLSRVHHLRSDISPRFEAVIEGAREKDAAKRWPLSKVLEEISQIYAAREFTVKDSKGANLAAEFLDRAQINLGLQDYYRALEMLDLASGFLDAAADKTGELRRRFDQVTAELASHREAVEAVRKIYKDHIVPVDLLMEVLYERYGQGAPLLHEEEKGIMQETDGDVVIIKRSLIDTILNNTAQAIDKLGRIDGEIVGSVHRKMVDRASSQEEACSDLVKRMIKFGEDYRRDPTAPPLEEKAEFELD